jgi:membrane fusion protein, multidrug efflux system
VRKGQALARLDPQDARLSAAAATAQVAVADADLAFAKAELERNRQLLEQKFISQAAYDNKLSAYRVAMAKRDAAAAQSQVSGNQAGYTTLVADSAGIITAVLAEAGQVVNAGQAVMKLARTEEREVWINVAESQAAGLQPGMPAQVSLWSQPQRIFSGSVREIAPAADALTRTYTAKISVADADASLRWGMTANVGIAGIRISAVAGGAIVVPLTALLQQGPQGQGEQASVWVVAKDNTVQPRTVQVARFLETGAVIAGGIQPGETIVVAGVHKLNPGEAIRPLPEPTVAATASLTNPLVPSLAQNQPAPVPSAATSAVSRR